MGEEVIGRRLLSRPENGSNPCLVVAAFSPIVSVISALHDQGQNDGTKTPRWIGAQCYELRRLLDLGAVTSIFVGGFVVGAVPGFSTAR
jgi:hypothetical protein